MRWFSKKRILMAFVSTIVAIAFSTAFNTAFSASYQWKNVVQNVEILPNGDVIVDDQRTLWTDEDFGEAYICLELTSSQSVELLEGSGAVGGNVGSQAFMQRCEDNPKGTELVVKHDRRIKEGRVRFHYKLTGATDVYSDVVQWYWIIQEQKHAGVTGYQLTVKTPAGTMSSPYEAYVHRFSNKEIPTVSLSDDRTELNVSFNNIPNRDGVEVRYLMDPALFTVSGSQAGLEKLLEDEIKIAGKMATIQARFAMRSSLYWLAVPFLLLLGLFTGIISAFNRFGKEPDLPKMKYVFEPPSDWPPAGVIALMQQSFSSSSMGPAFNATVMDLARQGYGEFRSEDGKGKKFEMQLFDKPRDGLEDFEEDVLNYLHRAAGSDNYIAFKELKRYSEKNLSKFLPKWGTKVRAWTESQMGGKLTTDESRAQRNRWSLISVVVGLICLACAPMALGGARAGFIVAAIMSFFGGLMAAGISLPAWKPEVAEQVYGWQGFKRTLADYSTMKEAPNDFYHLWDRYFCYAAGFGVAAAFLRNIQKAAPLKGIDEKQLTRSSSWIGSNMSSGDFKSFSKAVSSMSSSLSSSAASSGGSSSGGGGGGGGGSSGGR